MRARATLWKLGPPLINSVIYSFIHSFIHSLIHLCINSLVHECIDAVMNAFLHSFLPSFLPSFLHLFVRSFLPFFLHFFNHSIIHPFIRHLSPLTVNKLVVDEGARHGAEIRSGRLWSRGQLCRRRLRCVNGDVELALAVKLLPEGGTAQRRPSTGVIGEGRVFAGQFRWLTLLLLLLEKISHQPQVLCVKKCVWNSTRVVVMAGWAAAASLS